MAVKAISHSYWRCIKRGTRTFDSLSANIAWDVRQLAKLDVQAGVITPEQYAELIGEAMGDSFEMDTDFGITKQDCGATRMPEAYSKGTRDLFNLATRLGLIDALYEKEKPFLILDDPFTAFDDKKTDRALKLLRELAKDRQIIYFTCSKSRTV